MKWTLESAKFGDIVRAKMGQFYHYGIYVSDDEIIQFGLPFTDYRRDASTVEVLSTDVETFLRDNFLEVGQPEKKDGKPAKPKNIVALARSRIGEKGYHILYNNCEHFAFQCLFGKKSSSQVDEVRQMWKKFPFVNVYVRKFPFEVKNKEIYPKERQKEIDSCKSEKVREEKFYAWKLLEYGLSHSLGLDIKKVKLKKCGMKWKCENCCFSISHSDDIVAVAVARNDVGVDVEKIDLARFSSLPKERILTAEELDSVKDLPQEEVADQLNKIWTVKEGNFKFGSDKNFVPNKIQANSVPFVTKKIQSGDNEFYLTVVTKDISFIKFHFEDDITENK